MGKVVLVTGVAGDLGRRFALQLAESPDVDRVIGVDLSPPHGDHSAIHFIRLDIRNPVIAKAHPSHPATSKRLAGLAHQAALDAGLPNAFSVEVRFRRPARLPSRVGFSTSGLDGRTTFAVHQLRRGTPHVLGSVETI